MPGEVMCGEMVGLTVEVVNCGEVPLNSLRLTSSAAGRLLLLNTVSIITHNTPPVYASCIHALCHMSLFPKNYNMHNLRAL